MKTLVICLILMILMLLIGCGSEKSSTEKLLGVKVKDFPGPQGIDELGDTTKQFEFTFVPQAPSGNRPKPWYESISSVYAIAPDGSVWEAFCGHAGTEPNVDPRLDTRPDSLTRPKIVESYRGFVSTTKNTRQSYGSHLGYAYSPQDVYIGQREGNRLKTSLFFRDVGSHTTAPHHLAIDSSGYAHLAVADVNISDGNALDLYWVTGSTSTGNWTSAWLIDHRSFTSSSRPWNGAWGDRIHLLWDWDTGETQDPAMGLYHVEKTNSGFTKKTRIVSGRTDGWSGGLNPKTGQILVVVPSENGAFLFSKENDKPWSGPTTFPVRLTYRPYSLVESAPNGAFLLKLGFDDFQQWLITPRVE